MRRTALCIGFLTTCATSFVVAQTDMPVRDAVSIETTWPRWRADTASARFLPPRDVFHPVHPGFGQVSRRAEDVGVGALLGGVVGFLFGEALVNGDAVPPYVGYPEHSRYHPIRWIDSEVLAATMVSVIGSTVEASVVRR